MNDRNTRRPHNNAMYDSMNNIRGNIQRKPAYGGFKDPSPDVARWIEDGEDHINIWENANTQLGQILAHSQKVPMNHHIFGPFDTVEAFWHYIQSTERDDRIRKMTDEGLKKFAKKLQTHRVKNFRAIIIDTNYQKIKQYKAIVEEIKNSTLPFDSYYVNTTGFRVRHNYSVWLVAGFEEIRKAIKEDREPDLTNFMDDRNSDIYEFVIPQYMLRSKQKQENENNKVQEVSTNTEDKPKLPSLLSRVTQEATETTEAPVEQTAAPVEVTEAVEVAQDAVTEAIAETPVSETIAETPVSETVDEATVSTDVAEGTSLENTETLHHSV